MGKEALGSNEGDESDLFCNKHVLYQDFLGRRLKLATIESGGGDCDYSHTIQPYFKGLYHQVTRKADPEGTKTPLLTPPVHLEAWINQQTKRMEHFHLFLPVEVGDTLGFKQKLARVTSTLDAQGRELEALALLRQIDRCSGGILAGDFGLIFFQNMERIFANFKPVEALSRYEDKLQFPAFLQIGELDQEQGTNYALRIVFKYARGKVSALFAELERNILSFLKNPNEIILFRELLAAELELKILKTKDYR